MDRLFLIIQVFTVAAFFVCGSVLYRMGAADMLLDRRQYDVVQTSFVMDEPKPEPPKKKEEEKPKPVVEKKKAEEIVPIDLTEKPPEPEPEKEEEKPPEEKPPEPPPPRQVRQVYGLKKVYSQGLGAGGDASDAIVGKRGNTVNKDYDTLTATSDDLKGKPGAGGDGPVSSSASVTKVPRLKTGFRSRRPQYSKEMLENRVEGAVRARLLIGSDGKVRKVEIQSDLGYDSALIAEQFLMTLEFEPAMKGDTPVSVWIPFSIRFELI